MGSNLKNSKTKHALSHRRDYCFDFCTPQSQSTNMVSTTSKSKQLAAQSATADLPNLNRGLVTKQMHCSIHPSIVSQILDHYMRKPNEQHTVMGALLGNVDGSNVGIQTSFGIPFSQ